MGSRLGQRVIHFTNLPLKLILPSPPFDSIREFAIKTIPSATKIEIRHVLESLYGFDVAEVRTLNYEGKKFRRGFYLAAKPDYKKAYVTLRSPLSLSPELFPIPVIQESRERIRAQAKSARPDVMRSDGDSEKMKHWLDERREEQLSGVAGKKGYYRAGKKGIDNGNGGKKEKKKMSENGGDVEKKFPWSGMRLWSKAKE